VLVYPVGIPVLYAVRLSRVRSLLAPQQHPAQLPLEAIPLATAVVYDDSDDNSEHHDTEAAVPTAAPMPTSATGIVEGRTVHNVLQTVLRPANAQQLVLQETRFLWKAYKPRMYYWEVMECVRRLLLTGFVVCQTSSLTLTHCLKW
jgi:hypothetical protein